MAMPLAIILFISLFVTALTALAANKILLFLLSVAGTCFYAGVIKFKNHDIKGLCATACILITLGMLFL